MTQGPPVIDYEGSDYQTSFWDSGSRQYEDQVEEIALRRLLPAGGKLLLELGAGAGRNTPRYAGFERVALLDYSFTQLQQARARLGDSPRYTYVAANAYNLPFVDGLFDAATMIRTLHHMADAPLALRQARRVLQPGAIFILEFANKHNLKAILRYALRRQAWSPFDRAPVEFVKLNFDFHPAAVEEWLSQSGFTTQRRLTVSHFRIDLFKRLLPTSLLVRLDALAQQTGDWWQLAPSVFVRAQAAGQTPQAPAGQFFRCPACGHAPIALAGETLDCPGCGRRWPYRDGVYDLRWPQ